MERTLLGPMNGRACCVSGKHTAERRALAGAGMAVGAFMGRIILHINAAVFVTCMTILGLGFEAGGPGECGGAFGGDDYDRAHGSTDRSGRQGIRDREAPDREKQRIVQTLVMSAPLKHPTVEAVLAIHSEVLAAHGGGVGIRSREEITATLRKLLR